MSILLTFAEALFNLGWSFTDDNSPIRKQVKYDWVDDGAWAALGGARFTRREKPSLALAAILSSAPASGQAGWQEYEYAFEFTRHDVSGAFVGSSKVRSALVLDASGDAWTSKSQVNVFDAAGNLILAPCVTGTGTRFE